MLQIGQEQVDRVGVGGVRLVTFPVPALVDGDHPKVGAQQVAHPATVPPVEQATGGETVNEQHRPGIRIAEFVGGNGDAVDRGDALGGWGWWCDHFPRSSVATRGATKMATTAMTAVRANTPVNESPTTLNALKTIPVTASARAAPSESEIDSAALLNPWFAFVESASVITERRGYMRPMPAPPIPHPTMATAGESVSRAVAPASTTAVRTRLDPMTVAIRWVSCVVSRPWSHDAPAQDSAPMVRDSPASDGENSYRSMNRYGRYTSAPRNEAPTRPRSRMTLGNPRSDRRVPSGSSGRTAISTTMMPTTASAQPSASSSASRPRPSTAHAATTDHAIRPADHGAFSSSASRTVSPRRAGHTMPAAMTTRPITPRNTQCQLNSSVTTPAANGPMRDGITQAAANPAKICGCNRAG